MKILFVTHSFYSGGAEKCLDSLVKFCHARGHECLLVGPKHGPSLSEADSPYQLVVRIRFGCAHLFGPATPIQYARGLGKIILNVFSIMRIIQQNRPDVVYSNTSAVIAGGISAKLLGVPHIWHIHENLDTFKLRFILPTVLMKRVIAFLSDRVLFVSRLSMASVFPKGHDKATVIYNGVSIPPAKEIRIKTLAPSGNVVLRRIGFFGSADHRKGLDILMRAVSHLKNRYPNVILDVWGRIDINRYQPLQDLAARLGITENVQLRGFCENVPERLAEYSIVALPSRAEAFPMLALETMAAGVPLVVTRCGGPEELVVDGVDGFVVPVDDHVSLANAMDLGFSVPQRTLEMAQHARDKVATNFLLTDKLGAILHQMRMVTGQIGAQSTAGASKR